MKPYQTLFIERERAKPLIAFHGTSDVFLRVILKNGILPDPGEKTWDKDVHAQVNQQDRSSLYGSYWTTNLLTASSSALNTIQKRGGNRLFVIASIIPESAVGDEDDIMYSTEDVFNGLTRHGAWAEGLISTYAIYQADPARYKEDKQAFALQLHDDIGKMNGVQNFLKDVPIPTKLLEDFFDVMMIRQLAFMEVDDYGWKKNWSQGDYDHPWETIPLQKDVAPDKNAAERVVKIYQDKITRYYKKLALSARNNDMNATMRIMSPVDYRGRNRIIGIVREPGGVRGHYQDKDNSIPLELVYGVVPDEFRKEWEKKIGGDFMVKKV